MDIVFHLAPGKTATTFFQRQIFPKMKGVKVWGNNNEKFNIDSRLSREKINLISDEGFASDCLGYGHDDRILVADRIKGAFPHAKVFTVLRHDKRYIWSHYQQYVKAGGIMKFDEWQYELFKKNPNIFDFREFKDYLLETFDQALILNFEDFKKNPQDFVKLICDFVGCPMVDFENKRENVSMNPKTIERWRKLNKLFVSKHNKKGIFPHYTNPLTWYNMISYQYVNPFSKGMK